MNLKTNVTILFVIVILWGLFQLILKMNISFWLDQERFEVIQNKSVEFSAIVIIQSVQNFLSNIYTCNRKEVPALFVLTSSKHLNCLRSILTWLICDCKKLDQTENTRSSEISLWIFPLESNIYPLCCFSFFKFNGGHQIFP